MKRFKRIFFVSEDDTCRSPMARAIFTSKFPGPPRAYSRGVVVLFPEPVNQKAEAVLVSNGLSVAGHQSVALSEADFEEEALFLAMEEKQKSDILEAFPGTDDVYTLHEFLGIEGTVPNPIGKALVEYGECYECLESLLTRLAEKINEEESI